ncbi:hypothetical protein [Streptomyces chartreusis]
MTAVVASPLVLADPAEVLQPVQEAGGADLVQRVPGVLAAVVAQ